MSWVRGLGRPLVLLSIFAVGVSACSRADDAAASSKGRGRSEESQLLAAPAFQRVKPVVDELERKVATLPKNAALRCDLGKAYLRGGLRSRAQKNLALAVELDPAQHEARLLLVEFALDDGDVDAARALVDAGLKLKRSAGMLVADARTRRLADPAGARDAAGKLLEQALDLKPEHVQANYEYGVALLERGEVAPAVARFEKVVALAPNHLGAHFNLARAYGELGRTADADRERATHQRLGRLDDLGMIGQWDTIEASVALADLLLEGGDVAGAQAELVAAMAKDANDARVLLRVAQAYGQAGDGARARAAFEDAVARHPTDAKILNAHARYLATAPAEYRDPARAVLVAQDAVQRTAGEDIDCLDTLAEAYAAKGDFSHAIQVIAQAERVAPNHPDRKQRRAEIEKRAGLNRP